MSVYGIGVNTETARTDLPVDENEILAPFPSGYDPLRQARVFPRGAAGAWARRF